jgi:hypothetical protein
MKIPRTAALQRHTLNERGDTYTRTVYTPVVRERVIDCNPVDDTLKSLELQNQSENTLDRRYTSNKV